MLRLSINLLSNAIRFLSEIKSDNISCNNSMLHEKAVYFWAFSVDRDALLDVAITCNWIVSDGDNLLLTDRGRKILACKSYGMPPELLKLMLEDYVIGAKPIWRNRIPYGRKEATIFMSKDEKACFQEAGLLVEMPTKDVISWWDHISDIIRNEKQQTLLSTGRSGEEYTLEYEQIRTNAIPKWISIDSNLAGYDVLSKASAEDNSTLLIEVKSSSEDIDYACFYLSRNEWNVASTSSNYLFYLWHITPYKKLLAVLSPQLIEGYIPVDRLSGEWESVSIPFRDFRACFTEV